MKVKRNLLLCSWLSFFLLISVLPGNASVFAQQEKLALSSTQLTVREIFDAISSQLRYDVFYNGEQLDLNRKVKFAQQVLNLEQVLDAVANNRFKYTLEDRTIILTPLTTPQTVNSVTLTGQVTDQSNTPLPGVTVLVKGTKLGTSTDPEGNFKLSLPQQENTILIFSFIGMESQEVPVGDPKKPIKVILKETAENMKEVVVNGIFTRKKESFTGSASTYTASELKTAGTQNILQSLKTLDPSFAILDNTLYGSDPNRLPNMEIRGKSSMLGMRDELEADPNQPLFILDGFESSLSVINDMDINRIESMTILKDAAATALYGSRAANGVIVITTKKGASGKTKINLRADWGLSNMAINYRPILNGEDRREILHLGLANYALNNGSDETAAKAFADKNIEDFAARPWSGYTDWKDVLFRNGSHQNYEVSAQGGSEKTRFYTSFAYTKQEGITNVSGYERFTGRANVTHQANRLTLEANTMFTNSTQNVNNEGTSFASPIMCYAMTASPSTYPYNEDGSFSTNFPALNGANPIQTEAYNYNRSTINRFLGSLSATWNIWDNLNIKEVVSYDFNQNNERVWWDPRSNDGRSSNGVYQRVMGNRAKLNTQTQLTYNKVIAEKHTLDALIGFETEDYKYDYVYANGNTYPSYLPEIENAGNTRASSSVQRYRMTSFLGRLNYDYENKYYFSASFRRDGSSRLSRESRWGDFWSVSGSWRITSESFMENIKEVITDAKLRASYGVNGTQPSDYYGYLGVFGFGYNYNKGAGSAENRIVNPNMKWE